MGMETGSELLKKEEIENVVIAEEERKRERVHKEMIAVCTVGMFNELLSRYRFFIEGGRL